MEKLVAVFIALVLIFGYGAGGFPDDDLNMPDQPEVEEEQVTTGQSSDLRDEDIYQEYQRQIAGNASIEHVSESGDIYIRFEEQIAGTSTINLTAETGDIYVYFGDKITGNASVNLSAPNGKIVFANNSSTIESYIDKGNLNASAGKNIEYITGSIF
ncbi:MAG: hypothetical protein ACOCQF_01000 [Halanaerobiaceae bacterium]